MTAAVPVIGIDVGGSRKGFHAVALTDGAYASQLSCRDVQELGHWCRSVIQASVIAIDAPCRWSVDGRARPCERQLNAEGIHCFASPGRERAVGHPSNYYGWMLQGEALYRELEASHPLLTVLPASGPVCFETFPHAITWHMRGGHASGAQKRSQRRELLVQAGIHPALFTNIDLVDAALCACRPSAGQRQPLPGLWRGFHGADRCAGAAAMDGAGARLERLDRMTPLA